METDSEILSEQIQSLSTSYPVDPTQIIAPDGFSAVWKPNWTDEEYHSDTTAIGSTNLRAILKSPKFFYTRVFERVKQKESDALRLGKLIHMAVLEPERFSKLHVVCPDYGDMRSPINRKKRDEWLKEVPEGCVVLKKPEEMDMIHGIVQSVLMHPNGPAMMKQGQCEVAGVYRDEETGIRLKVKPDFLSLDGVRLNDLKSCLTSSRVAFGKQAFEKRYDIQMHMQAEGVRHITGKYPTVISLIAVEKEPPYESAIYYFEEEDLYQAKIDYRNALNAIKEAIDANIWPQRQQILERIYQPPWFMNRISEGE